ncbi:hypothetical protein V5O48_016450 [Marasmius crinis-equi]|uniref:Uncharacterized protein n=1 Tax=Marasmius crinis-equi TaxID=585013 RepID=A0ABR3ERN5_9AGAR
MPPKRSTVQMSRADLVRNVWAEFEAWHSEQLALLDERIAKALREIDQNRKPVGGKKKNKGKDKEKDAEHEKKKAEARKELEKTYDGDKVREEWQTRLDRAGLFAHDWNDMTENEQKKVERILGVDLDANEGDVTIIEAAPPTLSPPAPTQRTSPQSLATSPMSNNSRSEIMSDNFAFVDPASFQAVEEEAPYDNWLEVRHRIKSDDEVSLDASTTSSWGGGGEIPAYLAWSSEMSRSSAQSSQTSLTGSPDRLASKLPVVEDFHSNLVSSAVNRLALFGDSRRDSGVSNIKRSADTAHPDLMPAAARTSFSTANASGNAQASASSSKRPRSESRQRYIGPELVDDDNESVEAEQFREFKMNVRLDMIRRFHEEAAEADIQLAITIDQANQSGSVTKEMTARLVDDHEQNMLRLRQRKEKERKELVEQERQRRLAEFRQRNKQNKPRQKPVSQPPPTTTTTTTTSSSSSIQNNLSLADGAGVDPRILTEKFLRVLQNGPDAGRAPSNAVSDTPTIRSQLNRMRLPNVTDWLATANTDSGTDTPTPTIQSSGWKFKDTPTSTSALSDTPSFKRVPSGLAKSLSTDSASTSHSAEDARFTEPESSASEARAPSKGGSASSRKSESKGQAAKSKAESNKKKEKAVPVSAQTDGASSSRTKLEQMPGAFPDKVEQRSPPSSKVTPQANSANSSIASLPPPPVPLSTRPDIPATPLPHFAFGHPNTETIQRMSQPLQAPQVTQAPPAPSTSHHHQAPSFSVPVPDNHQRWVPPATKVPDDKRPQPSRTITEPPSKIKKSSTSQSTVHAQLPAVVETAKRSRRMSDPVSPSPRSFDYPNGKLAAQAPAKPNNTPSSILKKAGTSVTNKGTAKAASKSSGKVKKVTIEEVKDDEEAEENEHEHLPSDSRYIMEPKPVVAQSAYSHIIEFDEEELKGRRVEEKRAPAAVPPPPAQIRRQESESSSATASFAPKSNQIWIPPQSSIEEAKSKEHKPASGMPGWFGIGHDEKHVRWTQTTAGVEDDGGDRFLSGLGQLWKSVAETESERPSARGEWQRPDMTRGMGGADNGRNVGVNGGVKTAGGNVFWNPKVTNHRKPLATS